MRVVAFPQDSNPYQGLLHRALADEGVEATYLPMPTPSRTVNLLLMPVVITGLRLRGVRVLHLHWVFDFVIGGTERVPALRRLAQAWFGFVLWWCDRVGVRVVWTAHNVLPHDQVFHDDRAARATLLRHASRVLAHDAFVAGELAGLVDGHDLPEVSVVPHGPFDDAYTAPPSRRDARQRLGLPTDERVLSFVGRVNTVKGVDDLVEAWQRVAQDADVPGVLVVAGRCDDTGLRARLEAASAGLGGRLVLDLRFLPDDALADHLAAADVVVLPFRRVTTSGSALLATTFARAVVLPELPAFADVPDDAVVRFSPGDADSLDAAVRVAATRPGAELDAGGEKGHTWSERPGWDDVARRTAEVYRDAVASGRTRA